MAAQKPKIIYWGRHSIAPQKPEGGSYDEIKPEGFEILRGVTPERLEEIAKENKVTTDAIHNGAGIALKELVDRYGLTPKGTSVGRTNKDRTYHTGVATLACGFGFPGIPTKENELPYTLVADKGTYVEDGLTILEPSINLDIYKRDPDANIDIVFNDPEAIEHEGVVVEPGWSRLQRSVGSLKGVMLRMMNDPEHNLAVVTGHATYNEVPVFHAIRETLGSDLKSADFGGALKMGEYWTIKMEPQSNGSYKIKANLNRGAAIAPIDLNKI